MTLKANKCYSNNKGETVLKSVKIGVERSVLVQALLKSEKSAMKRITS